LLGGGALSFVGAPPQLASSATAMEAAAVLTALQDFWMTPQPMRAPELPAGCVL
jgi:hypothetical protein